MLIIWFITFALLESFCLAQKNIFEQSNLVEQSYTGEQAVDKFLSFKQKYFTCLNQTESKGRVNITINTIGEIVLHPVNPEEDWHNLKTDSDVFKCIPDTDCVVVVNDNQRMLRLDAQYHGIFHTTDPENLRSGDYHLNKITKHTSASMKKNDEYVRFSLFENLNGFKYSLFSLGFKTPFQKLHIFQK